MAIISLITAILTFIIMIFILISLKMLKELLKVITLKISELEQSHIRIKKAIRFEELDGLSDQIENIINETRKENGTT